MVTIHQVEKAKKMKIRKIICSSFLVGVIGLFINVDESFSGSGPAVQDPGAHCKNLYDKYKNLEEELNRAARAKEPFRGRDEATYMKLLTEYDEIEKKRYAAWARWDRECHGAGAPQ